MLVCCPAAVTHFIGLRCGAQLYALCCVSLRRVGSSTPNRAASRDVTMSGHICTRGGGRGDKWEGVFWHTCMQNMQGRVQARGRADSMCECNRGDVLVKVPAEHEVMFYMSGPSMTYSCNSCTIRAKLVKERPPPCCDPECSNNTPGRSPPQWVVPGPLLPPPSAHRSCVL